MGGTAWLFLVCSIAYTLWYVCIGHYTDDSDGGMGGVFIGLGLWGIVVVMAIGGHYGPVGKSIVEAIAAFFEWVFSTR